MKKKILAYMMAAVAATATLTMASPAMTVMAYTQDEGAEYCDYLNLLSEQGYTDEQIDAFLHKYGPDGKMDTILVAIRQGLKPDGAPGASAQTDTSKTTASETPAKDTKEEVKHEHSYKADLTTSPTCREEGVMTYTCSCGDTYTEAYPKVNHQYESEVTTDPTCHDKGETTYTCILCGDSYTEEIDMLSHTEGAGQTTKEATCTEEGERTYSCTVCGDEVRTEVIPAKGHTESAQITETEPGFLTDGSAYTECTVCHERLQENVLPAQMSKTEFAVYVLIAAAGLTVVAVLGYKIRKDGRQ